eukprot:jgi/Undpi1/10047/HiC_scaffold_28.g12501.m1
MDPLFMIDARHHGKGPVIFSWHPQGTLLASSGSNRIVHIFTCHGQLLHSIKSATSSACTALEWDPLGLSLAIAQANSSVVLLWFPRQWKTRAVDVGVKDVTFVSWSKTGDYLALGTGKGTMCIYHRRTNEKMWAAGKHKRRINCGAWSYDNQLAYGSDDKQISVTSETGQIQDQVKVKSRPLDVAFGGKQDQDECIVSVNMDGRTILLYNLHDQENALELAFQGASSTARSSTPDSFEESRTAPLPTSWLPAGMVALSSSTCAIGGVLGVGSRTGCLYTYVVRSGADDVSRLYPHASMAIALRPLPLARAVLAGAGALAATLAAIAYALGVPVQDVASAVLKGEGGAGWGYGGGGGFVL